MNNPKIPTATATIPFSDGMTAEKAKTSALLTAAQTFRVPLEVVSVEAVKEGFLVTMRRTDT